jgi:hypothetical protein
VRQTVAERVVERVDEALKADIMHWAAFYVRFFDDSPEQQFILFLGGSNANWKQENISP